MVNNGGNSNEEIRAVIENVDYKIFLDDLMLISGKKLCGDIYEAEIDFVAECLHAAKFTISDVLPLFTENDSKFRKFCIALIEVERQLESGEEFNPNDILNEYEKSNEEYVGHSKTAGLQYAIFYLLLTHDRARMVQFFKKIRQPHAGKYALRLAAFFDALVLR